MDVLRTLIAAEVKYLGSLSGFVVERSKLKAIGLFCDKMRLSYNRDVWNVILRSECGGTRWRTGGEVKGKLANGVGSQYCHTTSERGVSSITNADAHTSAASSGLNWLPRWFKWTRPFRRKKKCGFCACAIRFHTSCTRPKDVEGRTRTSEPVRYYLPSGKEHNGIFIVQLPTLWHTGSLWMDVY